MAVLSTATASGRVFYATTLPTTNGTLYTAPALSPNVTATVGGTSTNAGSGTLGSATAYIKEVVLNGGSSGGTVNIAVNGVSILTGVQVNANDTKVISGLNTMINATATITGYASASSIGCVISGVEIQ